MERSSIITWVLLMFLTISAGFVSGVTASFVIPVIIILGIVKFVFVAFSFMEMKKAHLFWQLLIIAFLCIFGIIVLTVIN